MKRFITFSLMLNRFLEIPDVERSKLELSLPKLVLKELRENGATLFDSFESDILSDINEADYINPIERNETIVEYTFLNDGRFDKEKLFGNEIRILQIVIEQLAFGITYLDTTWDVKSGDFIQQNYLNSEH